MFWFCISVTNLASLNADEVPPAAALNPPQLEPRPSTEVPLLSELGERMAGWRDWKVLEQPEQHLATMTTTTTIHRHGN